MANGLCTDEFVCKHKKSILKNPRLMKLFYRQYQPYLYKVARRIHKNYPSLTLEALVNEGFEGMLRALHKYNSDYASFLTYAQYWVNMKMNAYAHKSVLPINLPGNVHATLSKYTQLLQRDPRPTDIELCNELNLTMKKLKILQRTEASLHFNSQDIDEQAGLMPGCEECTLQRLTLEDKVFKKMIAGDIRRLLQDVLPEKECYVIVALFGLDGNSPKVLERVGKALSVSKERIRQIKEFAFAKIRESGVLDDFTT